MGRPARIDHPAKITLSLSAVCHKQLNELVAHFEAEPGRRTMMSRSELVERAVEALHRQTIPTPGKGRR